MKSETKEIDNEKGFVIKDISPGRLNALVKNMMKVMNVTNPDTAVDLMNSGIWIPSHDHLWKNEGDLMICEVISDGRNAADWIKTLSGKIDGMHYETNENLLSYVKSEQFSCSNGRKYKIAIIDERIFTTPQITFAIVREEATKRGLTRLAAEAALLFREKFSQHILSEMELHRVVVMGDYAFDNDVCQIHMSNFVSSRTQKGITLHSDYYPFPAPVGFAFEIK